MYRTEQVIYLLTEIQHESFTCGEDLLVVSHVPALLLPVCSAYYHIVAGRRVGLHLDVVDAQMTLHPKPGWGNRKICKYFTFHLFIEVHDDSVLSTYVCKVHISCQPRLSVITCRLAWCSSSPLSSSQHCNGPLCKKNSSVIKMTTLYKTETN